MFNNDKNLFLVFLGSFLSQIVQVGVFSLFLAQLLNSANVSLSIIGWFLGIQWGAVLLLAPFVPRLCANFGLENINKLSGITTIAGLLCLLLQEMSLVFALIASILLGLGLIMRWVACDTLVVRLSDPEKVGRSIGTHEALMGFGIAVGPLLFVGLSINGVFNAMLVLIVLSTLVFMVMGKAANRQKKQEDLSISRIDMKFIKIAFLIALVGGSIETSSVALLPFYFEQDGFSLQSSAWLVSAFGLGGTLLQLPLGYMVDKIGYQVVQLFACLVGVAGLAGLYLSSTDFLTVYMIAFIFGGAIGAFNTLAVIQAGSEISEKKSASAMAYIAICYTIGSFIGPIITAKTLASFEQHTILIVYGAVIGLVAMVILFTRGVVPNNK